MRTMREMFDHAKSYRVRSVHLGLRVGTVLLPAHIRDIRLAAEVRGEPLAVRQATAFFEIIQGVEDLRCQSGPTAFREHVPIWPNVIGHLAKCNTIGGRQWSPRRASKRGAHLPAPAPPRPLPAHVGHPSSRAGASQARSGRRTGNRRAPLCAGPSAFPTPEPARPCVPHSPAPPARPCVPPFHASPCASRAGRAPPWYTVTIADSSMHMPQAQSAPPQAGQQQPRPRRELLMSAAAVWKRDSHKRTADGRDEATQALFQREERARSKANRCAATEKRQQASTSGTGNCDQN